MQQAQRFFPRIKPLQLAFALGFSAMAMAPAAMAVTAVTLGPGANQTAVGVIAGDVLFNGNNATYNVPETATVNGNFVVTGGVTGSTLLFQEDSSHAGQIGAVGSMLATVTFNSQGNGAVVVLPTDVWATTTNLGNGVTNATGVTIQGGGITFGGDLIFVNSHTSLDVGVSRSTVTGVLNTNGGDLAFTLRPQGTAATATYSPSNYLFLDAAGSGKLTTGSLVMNGGERITLTYQGSLKDGATYTLIDNAGALTGTYNQREDSTRVVDNNYVLNSAVRIVGNDLVLTVTRANNEYITKSDTLGHFSNPAALALGTIAAQGRQLGDLVDAINTLELNQNGYGNTMENLAREVKRLAPVANNAYPLAMFAATDLAMQQVDHRLIARSGDAFVGYQYDRGAWWVKPYAQKGQQSGVDDYDGYTTQTTGVAAGTDVNIGSLRIGAALSYGRTNIEQDDFRHGDTATLSDYHLTLYGVHKWGNAFVDASAGMGRGRLDATRTTASGRRADTDIDYDIRRAGINLGYRLKLIDGKSAITPVVGIETARLEQPGYTESGAGDLGLQVDGQNFNRTRTKLGAYFTTTGRIEKRRTLLTLYAFALRDSGMDGHDIRASFTGQTALANPELTTFVTPVGDTQDRRMQAGADLALISGKFSTLQFGYQLDHAVGFNSHSANLKALWKF